MLSNKTDGILEGCPRSILSASSTASRKKLSVARKQTFTHEHPMCLSYSSRFEGTHGAKINLRIEFNGIPGLSKFMCNMNKLAGNTSAHITQHEPEVSAYDWTKLSPDIKCMGVCLTRTCCARKAKAIISMAKRETDDMVTGKQQQQQKVECSTTSQSRPPSSQAVP